MAAGNGQVVVDIQPAHSSFLTALHLACFTGQLEEVEWLLETNSSLPFQSPDKHGLTALHLAATGGHRRVAEALITASRGREANLETTATAQFLRVPDRLGRTALHHAARNGHASVVELLLGAPEAADLVLVKDGVRQSTAFLLAAMMPGDHVDTVRLLLERDPLQIHAKVGDPQLGVADLKTLMRAELVHKADEASLRPKFSSGDYVVTKEEDNADRLRGRGVSIAGHTALHLAASQDNVRVMAYLLKQPGVDVNAIDSDLGMTPLHCAVRTGALRVIKRLLRLPIDKLDVNAQLVSGGPFPPRATWNPEKPQRLLHAGDTALHLAIKFGSSEEAFETAQQLLRLPHLKPSIPNDGGYTALYCAVSRWKESTPPDARHCGESGGARALIAPQRLVDALAGHPDVQAEVLVNEVKQMEQGLQGTLNALLVAATLLAGITFAGFLHPPFGTTFEYHHPRTVTCFIVWNSLSFYFAIHTLLTALHARLPVLPAGMVWYSLASTLGGVQIGRLRTDVVTSTVAMLLSTLTGAAAFATAGFANLPPGRSAVRVMLASTVAGAVLITAGALSLQQGLRVLNSSLAEGRMTVPIIVCLAIAPCFVPALLYRMDNGVTNSNIETSKFVLRLSTIGPMILLVVVIIIVATIV